MDVENLLHSLRERPVHSARPYIRPDRTLYQTMHFATVHRPIEHADDLPLDATLAIAMVHTQTRVLCAGSRWSDSERCFYDHQTNGLMAEHWLPFLSFRRTCFDLCDHKRW